MIRQFNDVLRRLRAYGGDTAEVEVKSAAHGLPASITESLCALANLPGGGTLILGLDERLGFQPVRLTNPQALKQGLASKARCLTPPVHLTIADHVIEGEHIIIARVHECDRSSKPCRITATGAAYLRCHDGDFRLSELEEQGFLAARRPPLFDREPVEGATAEDLDAELVAAFLDTVRQRDPNGLGRFSNDAELLRRAGATVAGGQPTVAGLLALGGYPQQFFPRYVIQAAVEPHAADVAQVRAHQQVSITGAIPRMLDTALAWAARAFDTSIISQSDGSVTDRFTYPLVAFREIVANALVHRDLNAWSQAFAIEVRLRRDRLVVTNPGGLYGISVERLGRDAVTSARNARLVSICQYVRSSATNSRVIEALASGIPIVTSSLAAQGLPPPTFLDSDIRFTVILQAAASKSDSGTRGAAGEIVTLGTLNPNERAVYEFLIRGAGNVTAMQAALHLSPAVIRKALRSLRHRGLVHQEGGRGRRTTYRVIEPP